MNLDQKVCSRIIRISDVIDQVTVSKDSVGKPTAAVSAIQELPIRVPTSVPLRAVPPRNEKEMPKPGMRCIND